MRPAATVLVVLALTGCNRDTYSVSDARYDPSQLTSSSGEVSLSDGSDFDYIITSDRYRQWDAARKGLTRAVSSRFGALLNPRAPSERTIARATSYLAGQNAARQAIERTGMSVRDFVLMTVALEQQLILATQRAPMPATAEMPLPMDTMPIDSSYAPPAAAPYPVPYTPVPLDSPRRVDTVYLPRPRDTIPAWRDSIRARPETARDTLPVRRELFRPRVDSARDSTRRPPRDSIRPPPRDTLPAPPDSIPRA